MTSQEDRLRLLQEALARRIPDSREWTRGQSRETGYAAESEYWLDVSSPLRPAFQRLRLLLRRGGNIQVEYHIADRRDSPFEMLFVIPKGQYAKAVEEVSRFVADLLTERLVLAYRKGLFTAGRQFVRPESLRGRRKLHWVTSWLGTFDWSSTSD